MRTNAFCILVMVLAACSYDSSLPSNTSDGAITDGAPVPDGAPIDAAPLCNNGVKEFGEACDQGDLGGESCKTQGFAQGDLSCSANCQSIITGACFDCPLFAESGTIGLWCFEEGSGNSSDSLVAGASAISLKAGGNLPWANTGGLELSNQPLTLPSFAALEIANPWRVEVAADVTSISSDDVMLFERTLNPGQPTEVQHWLRMYIDQDRSVQCDSGRSNLNVSYRGVRSNAGVFSLGNMHIFACERDALGELHVLIDGVEVTTTSFGGGVNGLQTGQTVVTNVAGGNNSAAFVGTLRALAIHNTVCDIDPRPGTAGLWCLREGSGTTSANEIIGGKQAQGIKASEWLLGQGLDLASSSVVVNDDDSLDLEPPWSVQALVEFDTLADSAILERAGFDGTDEVAWLSLKSRADGALVCSVGSTTAGDYSSVTSSAGALAVGAVRRIECRRAKDGTLSIFVDKVDVSATTSGTPSTLTVADDRRMTIGFSDCATAQCSDRGPLQGRVLAWALRQDHQANVEELWSGVQGQSGLRYRSYSGSSFTDMPTYDGGQDTWFTASGTQTRIGRYGQLELENRAVMQMNPGNPGASEYPSPVVQWTAPANGDVIVHSTVMTPVDNNPSSGTKQRYYVNGSLVFTESLTSRSLANYSRTLAGISAGDTIQYEIYSNGASASDVTHLQYLAFDQPNGTAPTCTLLFHEDFEDTTGALAGTGANTPSTGTWIKGSPSNSISVVSGRAYALNDGPYSSAYRFPQGSTYSFENLRIRMTFYLPNASSRPVYMYVNGDTDATNDFQATGIYYYPAFNGGSMYVQDYATGSQVTIAEVNNIDSLLSINTDYYLEVQLDGTGAAGTLTLAATGYASAGGSVLATTSFTGLVGKDGSNAWIRNWGNENNSSYTSEVSVHSCP